MKRILILKRANLEYDVRVQRIAIHLSQEYEVTAIGTDVCPNLATKQLKIGDYDHAKLSLPERAFRKLRREILLRNIQDKSFEYRLSKDKWIDSATSYLAKESFDIIVACDIDSIIAVIESGNKAHLIGDMHEHAPSELANLPGWTEKVGAYRKWQCENYLPLVQTLFTVSNSLARLFESEFALKKIHVLRNVASYTPRLKPISQNPPRRLIHHGIAARIRNLEEHAVLAAALGFEYTVSMLLKPVEHDYYIRLKDAQKIVKNFHVIPAVEPSMMIHAITQFDAGVYLLNPATSQLKVTLPNKFFECVQARLPVFSGGLSEIDDLIDEYGVGVKLGTFDGVEAAEKIKSCEELDWKTLGENLDFAAKALSSQVEHNKISNKIRELLSE